MSTFPAEDLTLREKILLSMDDDTDTSNLTWYDRQILISLNELEKIKDERYLFIHSNDNSLGHKLKLFI